MPKISQFPNGFSSGITIRNKPVHEVAPGKVYWVGNNPTLLEGEKTAADANLNGKGGTYLQPFSTLDYAIGQCAAGRGDIIYVRPSHAISVTSAGGIALDVDAVQIIGLGSGEDRPIVTFATSTAASLTVDGDNCLIQNMVFKCNIASQAHMIDCTAKDLTVSSCDFREGSATGLSFITADTADNDSDRLKVVDCEFYAPTAGNMDNAIQLGKDFIGVRIENCRFDGDFDDAPIHVPAGGNAQVDLQILDCLIKQRLTNSAAISINGTDNSGVIRNCLLRTDTLATALDNGSLACDNVNWADETDQVSSTPVFASVDSASNALGVNDADNAFSSSSVVANLDGSVLERLEALMDPLGGYDPILGFRVTKVSNLADGSGTDDLFTVTGRCLITHLSGEVTTVIGGAATCKIRDTTNSVDLCAATTIDSDVVGTMYSLTSITGNILNGTGMTPVVGSVPNMTGALPMPMAIVGNAQAAITLAQVLDAADTGAITWVLYYKPLTSASSIVAAA